jgi:hypothetical protein
MSENGHLSDNELTTVQGSGANAIRLANSTAAIWLRMKSDAAKEGITLTLVASYHGAAGYRSWATQLDMRAHPSLYNIGKGFGLPGLPSEHGWGTCMDIDQGLAWVKANGHRYGVTFPIASDHNHARYDGITMAGETGSEIPDETPAIQLSQKGAIDMPMLYGTTTPAGTPVAQKYLSKNVGLAPGLPTYMLLGGSPGTPLNAEITQDQVLASQWAKQLAPTLGNPSDVIIPASWGWADALWDEANAPLKVDFTGLSVGGGTVSGASKADVDAAASLVISKIPTKASLS